MCNHIYIWHCEHSPPAEHIIRMSFAFAFFGHSKVLGNSRWSCCVRLALRCCLPLGDHLIFVRICSVSRTINEMVSYVCVYIYIRIYIYIYIYLCTYSIIQYIYILYIFNLLYIFNYMYNLLFCINGLIYNTSIYL